MEAVQYNAALARTGAIRGSSKEKLYQELGLETLQQRLCYRKLCCFYKILKWKSAIYLHKLVPVPSRSYRTRQCVKIPLFNIKQNFFQKQFLPFPIERNNLDTDITNCERIRAFLKKDVAFIRRTPNFTFNCHNPKCLKLLTRLRLGLSYLRKHKSKHSFHDSLNP